MKTIVILLGCIIGMVSSSSFAAEANVIKTNPEKVSFWRGSGFLSNVEMSLFDGNGHNISTIDLTDIDSDNLMNHCKIVQQDALGADKKVEVEIIPDQDTGSNRVTCTVSDDNRTY